MKKNNVAVDFVVFGELDADVTKKLEAFHENVTGGDGSQLAIIPPGPGLLSDQLLTSPILNVDGPSGAGAGGADGGGDSGNFEFGIDPSIDPELALALRMSMEEEKVRVDKQARDKAEADAKAALPEIKEEDEAAQSLLTKDGEPSGENKDDKKDDDAMDTA